MRQSCLIWISAAGSREKILRSPPGFFRAEARRKKRRLRLISGLALCFAASCASASGGFSVSNIPVDSRRFEVVAPGEETSLSWWSLDLGIIGLPLSDPPVARAERELLKRADGDALINLRYWNDRSVFLLFVNRQRFHLKADVVRFTDRK
jgi:hypothetical protein